jgi:hypothetical protein
LTDRAAPGARLASARQEGAEAHHGDALALRHVAHDRVEHRIHRFACRYPADVSRFCRNLDQIGLGDHVWHALSPLLRARILAQIELRAQRAAVILRTARGKHL